MFFFIYFLLVTLTYTQKCSFQFPLKYEQIYLCRENINSTSVRIWLHWKPMKTYSNSFSYYTFTLRVIDLLDEHKIQLEDRLEKQIGDYVKIDVNKKENNTLSIYNLSPGRYEICVNFFSNNITKLYYRSSNSCLYIPWNVPEHENEHPNLFIHVLFMFLIIILLVAIAFFIYQLHQYFQSPQPVIIENIVEENDHEKHIKFLVNQHFGPDTKPLESLVRNRIHQRYAHRFE